MGRTRKTPGSRLAVFALSTAAIASLVGCEVDSFIDPSVVGRWEVTPTVVPVLERLAAIEPDSDLFVETSRVTPDDLKPLVDDYLIGPGDQLDIRIRNFSAMGVEEAFARLVDDRGYLDLPRLGLLQVNGLSEGDVKALIERSLVEGQIILDRPIISVSAFSKRQSTYSALGAVVAVGTYLIPEPDYRLLEAITAAGGLADGRVQRLHIIRQIPLSAEYSGAAPAGIPIDPVAPPPDQDESGDTLIDLIDEMSGGSPSPGAMARFPAGQGQPEPIIDLVDPAIDLVQPTGAADRIRPSTDVSRQASSDPAWVFLDGRWVRVAASPTAVARSVQPDKYTRPGEGLVTQRVIEIPTAPLLAGSADYNIVIRPGDVIHAPPVSTGLVFMAGQVNRPGPYSLSEGLTLTRAITAAGGLGQLAIPERVDLMRMVGENRQATVRFNLRAIFEQTQPDIYLKANDQINVGTNFWAFPLTVFRNGLRMTYGFGFLLDRNFGPDVFGPVPTDRGL